MTSNTVASSTATRTTETGTTETGTTATRSDLEALKEKQHAVWSSGDYNKIAAVTVPVAEALVAAADPAPGTRVLDVATGTGHVALAAARRFGRVSAVDYVEPLVEISRRRADAEGLVLDAREGDAEQLPFSDAEFDVVLSAIGVMFTADHARAAAELLRVTRPGGTIALASWTPTGFVGRMLQVVGRHVAPAPVAQSPTRWGTDDGVRELLGHGVADLRLEWRVVRQRFLSADHFADFFLSHYGPTHTAAQRLGPDQRTALRDDLVALARSSDQALDHTFTSDWEYLVAVATRR